MNEQSQFAVPVARTNAKLLVTRRDGGRADRFCGAFPEVWDRVSDVDGAIIASRWAELGRLVPDGLAPVVRIQDWHGRLPLPSQWKAEAERILERAESGKSIMWDILKNLPYVVKVLKGGSPAKQWRLVNGGAVVLFPPRLVDSAPEQELARQIAGWLVDLLTDAIGPEEAARRMAATDCPWTRACRQMLAHLDFQLASGEVSSASFRREETAILANEYCRHLTELWSGQQS